MSANSRELHNDWAVCFACGDNFFATCAVFPIFFEHDCSINIMIMLSALRRDFWYDAQVWSPDRIKLFAKIIILSHSNNYCVNSSLVSRVTTAPYWTNLGFSHFCNDFVIFINTNIVILRTNKKLERKVGKSGDTSIII